MYMVMYAEVRENGVWHKVGAEFQSWFESDLETDRVCDERNDFLFRTLGADCNSVELARYVFPPTKEPKGLPYNLSEEIKNNYFFIVGDHPSYYTVKELLEFDWNANLYQTGIMPEFVYKRWKNKGKEPARWNYTVGSDVKIVTPFEMDAILEGKMDKEPKTRYAVAVKYGYTTLKDKCKFFYETAMPKLMRLGSPDDVRVVYTFCN